MAIKQPDYQLKLKLDLPEEEAGSGDPRQTLTAEDVRLRSEAARQWMESGETWKKDANGNPIMPVLMQEYYKLVAGGWKWRVAFFIIWLATPKKYRYPATQEELAVRVLGLTSDRQLAEWRTKNPVIEALARDIGAARALDGLSDSIEAMMEVAATPNYKGRGDRELHFKMAGVLADNTVLLDKSGAVDLSKLPWEEKLRLAGIDNPEELAAMRNKFAEEYAAEVDRAGLDTPQEQRLLDHREEGLDTTGVSIRPESTGYSTTGDGLLDQQAADENEAVE
jgi:hypothetical protein